MGDGSDRDEGVVGVQMGAVVVATGRRCLFCLQDSSRSVSVEHIVPESLGNTTMTLPPGVVCDRCNNYFAIKVEGPFLNSAPIVSLRHFEFVSNKRGRIPGVDVVMENGIEGRLDVRPRPDGRRPFFSLAIDTSDGGRFLRDRPTSAFAPSGDSISPSRGVARFVAKAGLELMAERNLGTPIGFESLLGAPELELCRRFARYGEGPPDWPVRVERIYDSRHMFEDTLPDGQRVWEMDFLSPNGENILFAMSIFGLEFAINLIRPDLSTYDNRRRAAKTSTLLYPSGVPADLRPARTS